MNNLSIVFLSRRQRIGAIKFNEGDSGSIYWTIKLGVKFPPHFSPSSHFTVIFMRSITCLNVWPQFKFTLPNISSRENKLNHFLSRFSRDRGSRQCLICHYIYKFGAYRRPIYVYRQPPTPRPYYIQPKHPTNIQPTIAEVRVWLDRVPVTPNRYLFLGSTRYYTIFLVLIRLSHDTCNILAIVRGRPEKITKELSASALIVKSV